MNCADCGALLEEGACRACALARVRARDYPFGPVGLKDRDVEEEMGRARILLRARRCLEKLERDGGSPLSDADRAWE